MDADPRQDRIESVFLRPSDGHFESLTLVDGRLFAATGPQGIARPAHVGPAVIRAVPSTDTHQFHCRPVGRGCLPEHAGGPGRWHFVAPAELYYQETRIAWDATPPLELSVQSVDQGNTPNPVELVLVLTDSQDETTTVPLSLSSVADARPPRLLGVTPPIRALDLLGVANLDRTLTLHFSEPVVLDSPDEPMVRLLYQAAFEPGSSLFQEMSLDLELTEGETNIRVGLPEDLPAGEYLLVAHPS